MNEYSQSGTANIVTRLRARRPEFDSR